MYLPFFIARRYFFGRKSRNVVNVISRITMAGIALSSLAMICTLSVFNGFSSLMTSLFTGFDPELRIVSVKGKTFNPQNGLSDIVFAKNYVEASTCSFKEQALVKSGNNQQVVTVLALDENYKQVYDLDNLLIGDGHYLLKDSVCEYGIMGIGLVYSLDCGMNPAFPLTLYAPKRGVKVNMNNVTANFNSAPFYSPGLAFQVSQPSYDNSYVIVPMSLARRLFDKSTEVTSIDLKIKDNFSVRKARRDLQTSVGPDFKVMDRYEQQSDIFRIVKLEKFISYLFLSFILLIACFNIIGSLIMLIIEKEGDTEVLSCLGLSRNSISNIFIINGILVSISGAVAGLAIGIVLALLQQHYGFIPLGNNGGFIVDSYPVKVKFADVIIVLLTVTATSLATVWPIKKIAWRFVGNKEKETL